MDGKAFVTAVKKGSEKMITDKTKVKEELAKMGLDFVVRLAVVMIGGNRLAISMGAASVSLEKMKELCTKKGAELGSARIPVMVLKLSGTKESEMSRDWITASLKLCGLRAQEGGSYSH